MRLNGKVVIVTGGTRGLGEATVRGIVEQGGRVVLGGRDEDAGELIVADLGENAAYVKHDASLRADWERIVSAALERFGSITGLVNNGAVQSSQTIAKITDEDLDRTIAVNLKGPILGVQHVAKHMRAARSGSIINVSSAAGVKAHIASTVYGSTKSALLAFGRNAALELAPYNVRVNTIIPGFFATRLMDHASSGLGRQMGAELTPLGRTAEPVEIVGPMIFLLSDEASFVTGAELRVDGGYTM